MLFCVLYQYYAVFVSCLMSEVLVSAVKVSSYDCFHMSCADGVDDFVGWVFSRVSKWWRLILIRLVSGRVWHGEDWLWVLWLLLLVVVLW